MAKLIDIRMPDGIIMRNVPDNTSREDIQAAYEQLSGKQQITAPPTSIEEDSIATQEEPTLKGEFKKGIGQTGSLLERAVKDYIPGYIAGALGNEEEAAKQFQDASNRLKEQGSDVEQTPAVPTLKDIKTPYDAALFASSQVGQGLSQLGITVAAAGTGAVAGGLVAGTPGAAVGSVAGAFSPSIPLNLADVTDSFVQEGLNPNEHKSLIAGTTGAISTIDTFTGTRLGLKAAGTIPKQIAKSLAVRMAKEGVKSFNQEAFTEAVQQVIQDNAVNIAANRPLDIDWNNTLTAAVGGGISGATTGAIVEALPTSSKQTKVKKEEVFSPEETVLQQSPETPDTSLEQVSTVSEPQLQEVPEKQITESPEQPLTMDERPIPPVESYEDVLPKPKGRSKAEIKKIADEIRNEQAESKQVTDLSKLMVQTANPLQQSIPSQNQTELTKNSKFNLYSNAEDDEGLNWRGYIKESLDLVGFDEDVIYFDPRNDTEEVWFGLDAVAPGIGKYKDAIQNLRTENEAIGAAVQFKDDNGKIKHLFFVNRDNAENKFGNAQGFIHDGLGHAIVNRFIMRNPEIKEGMFKLVDDKLKERGIDTTGVSIDDINLMTGSWSFDDNGEPTFLGSGNERFTFSPIEFGSRTDETLPDTVQYLQYKTAKDEVLTEQIARWFQTNEPAVSVMDKFFKSIADMYRKFLETARAKGLLPWREIDDFMNDLVLKARGKSVAEQYTNNPGYGLQELKAYHGSPHRFSEFSTENIGTGEGYQAFGWGLYFTSKKGIAEFYKNKLSTPNVLNVLEKNGEYFDWKDIVQLAEDNNWIRDRGEDLLRLRQAFGSLEKVGYDKAKQLIAEFGDEKSYVYNAVIGYLNLLKNIGFDKPQKKKGATYEVTIPEESEMLDWDGEIDPKPYTLMGNRFSGKVLGQELYQQLVDELGSPRAASEFLNSLGIKGIKYKAGQIAGIDSNGTNYVIFDDASIQINKVYDDDNLFAQLKGQSQNKEKEQSVTNRQSPFSGYRVNPKIMNEFISKPFNGVNPRVMSVIRGFVGNFANNNLGSRTNVVQQYLVLTDALTSGGIDNTYLPEVFRGMIKNTRATPDEIRNVLNNNTYLKKMSESIRKFYGLSKHNMNSFNITDIQAESFRLRDMRNKLRDTPDEQYAQLDSFVQSLPEPVKRSFDFLDALRNQIKRDLNNNGIINSNDLIQGLNNQTLPSLDSLMTEINDIRDLSKSETLYDRGIAEALADDAHGGDSSYEKQNIGLGWAGRNAITPHFWARQSPLFAEVVNAAEQRREAISSFQHIISKGFENFFNLPVEQRDYLGKIFDEQRILGNKASVDTDAGTLTFKRRDKDGKEETVTLKNPQLTNIYDEVRKTFSIIPLTHKNQLKRAFLPFFAKANLGLNPSKQQFERYKAALEKGDVIAENRLTNSQLNEIEQYFDTISNIDQMLERDYIPHERNGNTGVTIKDSQGNLLWFGSYVSKPNGKPDNDSLNEMNESLKEWRKNNPKLSKLKESKPFSLTQDNITRQLGINNKALTIELLNQLLASKLPQSEVENLNESVFSKITPKAFLKHFNEAKFDNVPGYSTDWSRVLSSYSNKAAYFLGNMENEPKLMVMNSRVQNSNNATQSLKDFSQKYVESILSPKETFAGLREAQYLYAMGGNISSAVLQLSSMATFMPATLTLATNNPFTAVSNMTKGTNLARKFFKFKGNQSLTKSLFAFDNDALHEELIRNKEITRQQSDIIKSLYNQGLLQALRSGDLLGVPSDISTKSQRGKIHQKWNNIATGAGFMMRTTEEFTRGVQAFSAVISLDSPDNARRLHNNLMQNDQLYRTKIEQSFTKEPDYTYMTKWLVDRAMGRYGREGRSALQNTSAAVTIMPFATYPTQMLLNTYELIKGEYGKAGAIGGIYAMVLTGIFGGALAVPGGMFIKELVELTLKLILGEDKDLEEELKSYAQNNKVPEKLVDFINNGLFAEVFGVQLTPRLAVDVPVLTELLRAFQGEIPFSFQDLLGVQGAFAEIPGKVWEKAMQGATPMEIVASALPSTALQNVLKSEANRQGVIYRGMPSLTQEEGQQPLNAFKRAIGFKPLVQGEREKRIDISKKQDTQYDVLFDRYRVPITKGIVKELTADNPKDREKYKSEVQQLIREYIEVLQRKDQPNIGARVKNLVETAKIEAFMRMQGIDGLAVKKQMSNYRRKHFEDIYNSKE